MKLVNEGLKKMIILAFILISLVQVILFLIVLFRCKSGYKNIINFAKDTAENKLEEINAKFRSIFDNLIIGHKIDLKIIGKHLSLFTENHKLENDDYINIKSEYYKEVLNSRKKVISSKIEDLKNEKYLNKYFSQEKNSYDYIPIYEEEFLNNNNIHETIENLYNDSLHPELNAISFLEAKHSNNTYNSTNNKTHSSIKYLISVLKTIYVRKYIIRRNISEYSKIIFLSEDGIYIYPPNNYESCNLYFFKNIYRTECDYNSIELEKQFPNCVFNALENIQKNKNNITIFSKIVQINFENLFLGLFLYFPPSERQNGTHFYIEIEIDFNNFLKEFQFDFNEKYQLGIFTKILGNKIASLFTNKKGVYKEIKKVFNNDTFGEYKIDLTSESSSFLLFHFLYYDIFTKERENKIDGISLEEIKKEYSEIKKKILEKIEVLEEKKDNCQYIDINKTIYTRSLYNLKYKKRQDLFMVIICSLPINLSETDSNYILDFQISLSQSLYFFSMIEITPNYILEKLWKIIILKIIKLFILFFFLSVLFIILFALCASFFFENNFKAIDKINDGLKNIIEENNTDEVLSIIKKKKIFVNNKEMKILESIFETIRRSKLIKQSSKNELFLKKNNNSNEFSSMIQNIENEKVKIMCNMLLAYHHFKNGDFEKADGEFKTILLFIHDQEIKLTTKQYDKDSDKLKDTVKRYSETSYLNEYTTFKGIDENLLSELKIKLLKQRINYFRGLCKYFQAEEIKFPNKKSEKNTKKIQDKLIEEAITFFEGCKNINESLDMNHIKGIYSTIMISKCYLKLNRNPESERYIKDALLSFFKLSKTFNDTHSKNYNPCLMIFIETNIFQYILFFMCKSAYINKEYSCCAWIVLKMFETSPFLLTDIHFESSYLIQNCLHILGKKNNLYEEEKKYFNKICSRIHIQKKSWKDQKNYLNEVMNSVSNETSIKVNSKADRSVLSSIRFDGMGGPTKSALSQYNSFKANNYKMKKKLIILCVSEKALIKINNLELKDVLIKYFKKYFDSNDTNKFGYLQFSSNGKKTIYIKPEKKDTFLFRFQSDKDIFELKDRVVTDNNIQFQQLLNLFDLIIQNFDSKDNMTDNIILMLINTNDFRFNSEEDCIYIVKKINDNNTSVFFLSFDEEINEKKINNINSFMEGLFEGYFIQVKNYQQIKQIFLNISTKRHQSNFTKYKFENLELII